MSSGRTIARRRSCRPRGQADAQASSARRTRTTATEWVAVRDHPEYSGQFLWSGIDYLGESRTWPTIGSGSGLLLSAALPHGRAFERQSWWATTPMVAMVRRTAAVRPASIDPGYANATSTDQSAAPAAPRQPAAGAAPAQPVRPRLPAADPPVRFSEPLLADWTPKNLTPHTENVEVYTNAEEVELFLNGKSLGTAEAAPRRQRHHLPGSVRAGNAEGGCEQRRQGRCHRGTEDGGQTGAHRLHRGFAGHAADARTGTTSATLPRRWWMRRERGFPTRRRWSTSRPRARRRSSPWTTAT